MTKCYYCGKIIIENQTKPEHIIPNAVGGKLTSRKILCNDCNCKLSDIDQSLTDSVYVLTNLFNPSRDNKTKSNLPLDFEINKRKFIRESDGKYYSTDNINIEKTGDGKFLLHINALYSTDNGAKEKILKPVFKIIEGFAKKYNWDEAKTLEIKEKTEKQLLEKDVTLEEFPGFIAKIKLNQDKKLFLAMLKIAIGYYTCLGCSIEYIAESIKVLIDRNIEESERRCYYYFPKEFYYNDSIYHTIFIKGDSANQIIYCLISIYGCINCVVLLNDNYKGSDFEESYCYDLRNHKTVPFNKSINISKQELEHSIIETNIDDIINDFKQCFDLFMSFLVQHKITIEEIEQIIDASYETILKKGFLSKDEYKKLLENEIRERMQKATKMMYFLDKQKDELIKIAFLKYSYHYYLESFCITSILSKIITENLVHTIFTGKTLEECNKTIKQKLLEYKSDVPEITEMLSMNIETYLNEATDFVETQYQQIKKNME